MLKTVRVPEKFAPLFDQAQEYVSRYFADRISAPERGTLEISGQRYVLVRAASLSVEFHEMVTRLYGAEDEALAVARSLLFDIAHAMGLAPLVGAFAAGLVLEDLHSARFVARGERSLSQQLEPISGFLVPIFFVVMGIRADLRSLLQPGAVLLVVGLTIAAIAGKWIATLGAGHGVNRLAVAAGMMPRGEVTLIFASLGRTLSIDGAPIIGAELYAALVTVVILTTLFTPLALKLTLRRRSVEAAETDG